MHKVYTNETGGEQDRKYFEAQAFINGRTLTPEQANAELIALGIKKQYMKLLYIVFICCFFSCKKKSEHVVKIRSTEKNNSLNELKKDIGLPKSYVDTLSLISYHFDDIDNDKKFLIVDYKKKLDSLYEVMDEELNIIGFEDHFTEDARKAFDHLKKNYIKDEKASSEMWNASYGINYRSYRNDKNAFKRIQQMIYKRRYEELLIYNFHLRSNLTRCWETPNTFLYRKRLKDVMPIKVLDSMYPKKEQIN